MCARDPPSRDLPTSSLTRTMRPLTHTPLTHATLTSPVGPRAHHLLDLACACPPRVDLDPTRARDTLMGKKNKDATTGNIYFFLAVDIFAIHIMTVLDLPIEPESNDLTAQAEMYIENAEFATYLEELNSEPQNLPDSSYFYNDEFRERMRYTQAFDSDSDDLSTLEESYDESIIFIPSNNFYISYVLY